MAALRDKRGRFIKNPETIAKPKPSKFGRLRDSSGKFVSNNIVNAVGFAAESQGVPASELQNYFRQNESDFLDIYKTFNEVARQDNKFFPETTGVFIDKLINDIRNGGGSVYVLIDGELIKQNKGEHLREIFELKQTIASDLNAPTAIVEGVQINLAGDVISLDFAEINLQLNDMINEDEEDKIGYLNSEGVFPIRSKEKTEIKNAAAKPEL